jgi:hypothetical protein
MKRLIALSLGALSLALSLGGCYEVAPAFNRDTATQLNADRRFAHDSSGQIVFGPSIIDEIVVGQRDRAGNVHVSPEPLPQQATAPVHRF